MNPHPEEPLDPDDEELNRVRAVRHRISARCGRYQLQLLQPGLYGGVAGIALFLAALHALTGHPASRETALRALTASRSPLLGAEADRGGKYQRQQGDEYQSHELILEWGG